jgi:outer membrane protein OmpA-like peptidoglycan-associated protein
MEVIRTKAVDRYTPVTNIFIDAEGNKWVGNRKGLFQVYSPEQGSQVNLLPAEWSLLQTPSGNYDLRLPLDELIGQMGSEGQSIRSKDDRITAATFDEKRSELWVGTRKSGLFQFKTQPSLKLVQRHHNGNSRLISNQVNSLFLDNTGRLWIGTGEGCVYGKDGKWSLEEKVFSIQAFAQNGTDIWVMGNDLLWKVNARGSWEPIDIDESLTEAEVVDIAFDSNGLLWVASDIVARFDPATEESKVFGPAEEFTSQDVSCMAIDKDNAVWIGTNDKGLYLIQKADAMAVTCLIDKTLSCGANSKDAALKVIVDGGTAPYNYQWSGGLGGTNPQNLGPGEYSLTVTDSKGKSKSTKVLIPDPNLILTVSLDKPAGESGASDGKATVSVKGGNPDYTYRWDNGETTATASRLNEGNHAVTVTDKAGCTAAAVVNVSRQIGKLVVTVSQIKNLSCPGSKDAVLKVEATGGKEPFAFEWADGVTGGAIQKDFILKIKTTGRPNASEFEVSAVSAGKYNLNVKDATAQSSAVQIEVTDPQAIVATIKVDAPASTGNADGKATAKASGGTGNFTFKWDNGETAATAAKLNPGSHTLTVTDGNGCTATAAVNITENILPLSVSISQTAQNKCAGEKSAALQAEVSGGKGPFRFAWTGGAQGEKAANLAAGSYDITVTDATGATTTAKIAVSEPKPVEASAKVDAPASTGNSDGKATAKASGGTGNFTFKWDNGETAATAVKLGTGSHTVTVTDGNGCTATAAVNITENILPLSVSISQTAQNKCAGESSAALLATISGGKGPFSVTWQGGKQGETASNLKAGTYEVVVSDVTGTKVTSSFTVKEPKPLEVTSKVEAPASTGNADGKASVKTTGGTGNYTYRWDSSETLASAGKLAPGQHNVTVTDESGCTATATVTISENILPLSVNISKTKDIRCAGEKSGALKAEALGGKGPFRFAWTGGTQGETVAGLAAGSYAVTVTDATGQTQSSSVQIAEPQAIKASVTKTRPSTTDKTNNGKASVVASGGVGGFKYKWDNGETVENAVALAVGQHSVTITDENGCQAVVTAETKARIIPELTAENLRSGEIIKLEKIYFQPDSTRMEASSIPTVDELFDFLQENPGIVIEVGGHTNGIPSHEFCDQLSSARAKSVAQYLVDKGIPTSRITYKGYGKRNPVATNATPEGRAKNQRVEIKIVRLEGD